MYQHLFIERLIDLQGKSFCKNREMCIFSPLFYVWCKFDGMKFRSKHALENVDIDQIPLILTLVNLY